MDKDKHLEIAKAAKEGYMIEFNNTHLDPLYVAIKAGIKIEEMHPLEYAVRNNRSIEIKGTKYPAIEIALKSTSQIQGKNPIDFMIDENIEFIDHEKKNNIYAFAHFNEFKIRGMEAHIFAQKHNKKMILDGKIFETSSLEANKMRKNLSQKLASEQITMSNKHRKNKISKGL